MFTRSALLAVGICLFLACPLLYGQATGSISGTVSDASGSVVSGAKVTVTVQAIGLTRDTTTDDGGRYLIPLLPVGSYAIRVEMPGFQPSEAKDVRLQV